MELGSAIRNIVIASIIGGIFIGTLIGIFIGTPLVASLLDSLDLHGYERSQTILGISLLILAPGLLFIFVAWFAMSDVIEQESKEAKNLEETN